MMPVSTFLEKNKLETGDHVFIRWKNQEITGIILPHTRKEEPFLHVKMDSGYNTGLDTQHISEIKKIEQIPSKEEDKPLSNTGAVEHSIDNTRPGFSLIGVGGTIASKVNYETGGVSAKFSPDDILQMIPQIGSFARPVRVISPFTKMSEDLAPRDWGQIAKTCYDELVKEDVHGIILTQGTDTLHYTSAALSFAIQDLSKPIVVVGSQRSPDRGSSDAWFNIICAARIAVSDIAEVGICMHGTTSDDYCLFNRGTNVRKMHTSRRDAFRPINRKPIAHVFPDGKLENVNPHHVRSEKKPVLQNNFDENVVLIKIFPGMREELVMQYVQSGATGIILEATGLGNIPLTLIPSIKKITEKGISVFVTAQTIYGRVSNSVYSNLRLVKEAGAVSLEDMLSETAFVKLSWVLGQTKNLEKVREMMLTNYAGEISPTSETDVFLN